MRHTESECQVHKTIIKVSMKRLQDESSPKKESDHTDSKVSNTSKNTSQEIPR